MAIAMVVNGGNAHVFLTTSDRLFFTEIDGRGGRNTIELVPGLVDEIKTTPEFSKEIIEKKIQSAVTISSPAFGLKMKKLYRTFPEKNWPIYAIFGVLNLKSLPGIFAVKQVSPRRLSKLTYSHRD